MKKKIVSLLKLFGIRPLFIYTNLKNLPYFFSTLKEIQNQLVENSEFKIDKWYPILTDRFAESGSLDGHYFHQDLFIAQKVFKNNPEKHVDIGSRINGFVSNVASFRTIEVFDVRPLSYEIKNIKFSQADFTKLDSNLFDYTDSISSLHALEHFGLGRYNDPIDIDGHLKGLDSIYNMLKKKGKFYFSVPMGPQRIEFNAHRVYNAQYLLNILRDKYIIDNFSYIDDKNILHKNVNITSKNLHNNFGCTYGCAIFELTKI